MKYKNLITVATVISAIFFAGCTTTQTRQLSALDVSGKTFETKLINPLLEPVVEVGGRINGHGRGKTILGFIQSGDSAKVTGFRWDDSFFGAIIDPARRVRDYALFEACQKENADFIVCPRYVIKTKNYVFFQEYDVTVSGFAGKYVSFRYVPWGYETRKEHEINKDVKRVSKKYDFGKIKEVSFGNLEPANVNIKVETE